MTGREASCWNWEISIHTLREEGDPRWAAAPLWSQRISIHTLREEGDAP